MISEINKKLGKKGQKARMQSTTKEQRIRWARKASRARWRQVRIEKIAKLAIASPPR